MWKWIFGGLALFLVWAFSDELKGIGQTLALFGVVAALSRFFSLLGELLTELKSIKSYMADCASRLEEIRNTNSMIADSTHKTARATERPYYGEP